MDNYFQSCSATRWKPRLALLWFVVVVVLGVFLFVGCFGVFWWIVCFFFSETCVMAACWDAFPLLQQDFFFFNVDF